MTIGMGVCIGIFLAEVIVVTLMQSVCWILYLYIMKDVYKMTQ